MKKIYLFLLMCFAAISLQAQEQLPQWANDLLNQNQGMIDSIYVYLADPKAPDTRTYIIYYNQPTLHERTDGEHFHMRALLTVYNDADPTQSVNHIYCPGYSIPKESLDQPDYTFKISNNQSNVEISKRYHANYFQLEHRYFQYSSPVDCWNNLDPLRAEEAAADFHNFVNAIKKVFKGKYVMSGVSKGGTATLLQHRFYPEDMDIYVPYSAPFFPSDRDTTMQAYWYTQGLSPKYNDWFMSIRKFCLDYIDSVYPIYEKMQGGAETQAKRDTLYGWFLGSIGLVGYEEHSYQDTTTIAIQLNTNDSIMRSKGIGFGDTVCAYMLHKNTINLDSFPQWLDTLRKYPDPQQAPKRQFQAFRSNPFGITYNQWWENNNYNANGYAYQSKCELGYYDLRFDIIYPDEPEKGAMWNKFWKDKYTCMRNFESPFFASLTFDRSLYDATMTTTQQAVKPIVLIYGEDDAWTGAAVKDEYINGTNVRKFIIPGQNHLVRISSNADNAMCDEIRSILDNVLGKPTGIDNMYYNSADKSNTSVRKIIRNGQILIVRDNKTYNLQGQELK